MPNYINDNKMEYNLSKHRYALTETAMEEDYGISLSCLDSDGDISPETLPRRYLDRVSLILYTYIYSWCIDRDDTEYVLSLPENRETILNAMEELCYSFLMNNTDPNLNFTGDTLKSIEVNPAVQTILMDGGVLFRGKYIGLPQHYKDTKGEDY